MLVAEDSVKRRRMKTIEKRICPLCHKPVYSSSFQGLYECPYCGKAVSASETKEEVLEKPNCGEVEECSLYEHCEGCPAIEEEGEGQNV